MNIKAEKLKIEQQFQAYEKLQNHHLKILKTQEMPDLSQMSSERKLASDRLTQAIDGFIANAGSFGGKTGISIMSQFEIRLGKILKLDETIRLEIENYRTKLTASLKQLKHGKTAMQGYKPADPSRTQHRVLSISR